MLDEDTKNEIFSYVEATVEDNNFFEYKTEFVVTPSYFNYENYKLLVHVNIDGVNHNGIKLFMDFTIKMSEKCINNNYLRKMFTKETYVYKNILPCMFEYLPKKQIWGFPKIMPDCYKTFSTKKREVIVFNGLQKMGYIRLNRDMLANTATICVILSSLAKLHALSFSLQEQKYEEFLNTIAEWQPDIKCLLLELNVVRKLKIGLKMTLDMLSEENRIDLKDKLLKDIKDGVASVIDKTLSNIPDETVMTHGDAWLYNAFIKYEKDNPEVPKSVKFVNWNLSSLHSPILDLAYFLYFTYSEDVHTNFESYVEYYYDKFSKFLVTLGTDPTKFSFLTLLDHWKKYSIMPLVFALGGIPLIIAEEHHNFDAEDYESPKYNGLKKNVKDSIKTKILGILELHYKYFE